MYEHVARTSGTTVLQLDGFYRIRTALRFIISDVFFYSAGVGSRDVGLSFHALELGTCGLRNPPKCPRAFNIPTCLDPR